MEPQEIPEDVIQAIQETYPSGIIGDYEAPKMSDDEIEQFLRTMSQEELLRFDRIMEIVLNAVSDTEDDEELAKEAQDEIKEISLI